MIASEIAYMKSMNVHGNALVNQITNFSYSFKSLTIISDSVKTLKFSVHPYPDNFTNNSKIIIHNLFNEHTAH